mmetsp:Transcript_41933/g.115654  ORF Transcript_41933/g.115654 Transcript_41933/m.115654 type:complete len:292 (+) Transcript_41933:482-1357(+)
MEPAIRAYKRDTTQQPVLRLLHIGAEDDAATDPEFGVPRGIAAPRQKGPTAPACSGKRFRETPSLLFGHGRPTTGHVGCVGEHDHTDPSPPVRPCRSRLPSGGVGKPRRWRASYRVDTVDVELVKEALRVDRVFPRIRVGDLDVHPHFPGADETAPVAQGVVYPTDVHFLFGAKATVQGIAVAMIPCMHPTHQVVDLPTAGRPRDHRGRYLLHGTIDWNGVLAVQAIPPREAVQNTKFFLREIQNDVFLRLLGLLKRPVSCEPKELHVRVPTHEFPRAPDPSPDHHVGRWH